MSGLTREEINRLNDLKNELTEKEIALQDVLAKKTKNEEKISIIEANLFVLENIPDLDEEELEERVANAVENEIITQEQADRFFSLNLFGDVLRTPQQRFETALRGARRNVNAELGQIEILENDIQETEEGIQDLESRLTPNQAFSENVLNAARDGTGTIAYPADVTANHPYLLFRALRPLYDGGRIARNFQVGGIALYMPMAYAIGDSLSYQTADAGIFGTAIQNAISRFQGRNPDVDLDENTLINTIRNAISEQRELLGEAGDSLLQIGGRRVATALADFVTPGTNAGAIADRARGRASNPHQFSIFQTPDLRSFTFNFIFIPQNEWEARVVPLIIKFFRTAAYPSIAPGALEYIIPDSFSITLGNLNQDGDQTVIRIPEVFCTSVNVSYNPRSMSYFKYNNMPSEIEMQLSFREVQPITREMVEEGY